MGFLDFLFTKKESFLGTKIGSVECNHTNLTQVFTGMAQTMGIAHSHLQANASKGIAVRKKNDHTYVVTLYAFNPPLEIEWSSTIPLNQLTQVIQSLVEDDRPVGGLNYINTNQGAFVQLALTK